MYKSFLMFAVVLAAALAAPLVQAAPTTPPPVKLTVDLTDAARAIYHVKMTIPVAPGPLTLVYPKWIPGDHAPTGPLPHMAGLVFEANGKQLDWHRDPVKMYAFHLTVPKGVDTLDVSMDMVGMHNVDPYLADMAWNSVLLYPAGVPVKDLRYQASLRLPTGWKFATALDPTGHDDSLVHFAAVPLNTLVDSPVMAGMYYRRIPLDSSPRVTLNLFADAKALLNTLSDKQIAAYKKLPEQMYALFGSHHYDHYDFLMAISDNVGNGLEHHQSSEDGGGAQYFANSQRFLAGADLLTHEYTHSWNGKFLRPKGLATPDYQQPMQDRLLWVYEGLTQYIGDVMAVRIGLRTPDEFRQQLAHIAAVMDHRTGRTWRNLEDTAVAGPLRFVTPRDWANYKRISGIDFYTEGVLVWLDVDTKIRELSHDRHSLNDFCRLFYGIDNGSWQTIPYTFNDLVATLNKVQPYDWAAFLHHLLDRTGQGAPLDGVTRSGWKLTYTDTPSDYAKAIHNRGKDQTFNLMFSIGLKLDGDGKISDVLWNGPAFKAGLGAGMTIMAVNGMQFTPEVLKRAIVVAKQSGDAPIKLLVKNQNWFVTYDVDYHDGLRYPHLERNKGQPDYLGKIISPLPTQK
ncbi:MAG TPA: M61 family peptidase [Gammaproteobacteria bacterium]|nr:M61 family peptidase [Gammaproteobacteria bacterium]